MKGKTYRTATILLSFFLVLGLIPLITAQAQQNNHILTVDKSGEGDYTTIQEAINNAPDMATIYIKAGIYSEIIDITKSINLIGENEVVINPISEKNSYAMRVGAPGTKISKLSVTNGAPGPYTSGIYISASNTEIEDCNLYDTPIGLAVWTSNNIINNCTFWGCKDEGIALLGSKYSACNDNEITNCVFHDNCDGIELQYSSNNIITNCEFYNNTHTGIDAIASFNDKNTITSCTIYNNNVNGIYLSSSSDNQIMDCSISNNKDGNVITTGNSYNNEIANINSYTPDTEKTIENTKNSILNAIPNIKIKNYITSFLSLYFFHM
jgi:parallel beta-helix repeat protein